MSLSSRRWLWLALLLATGTGLGGVVGQLLHIDGGRTGSWFGILVLVSATVALLSGMADCIGWRRALLSAAAVTLLGGSVELLGLFELLPFGRYEYTDWWLPFVVLPDGKLFPLLLPVTWFLIIAIWFLLLARRLRGWRLVLATGACTALSDVALEPVITRVVWFWRWLEPTPFFAAPYGNSPMWLATATLGAAFLSAFGVERARSLPHPLWMVPTGLLFIAALGLTYGQPGGALALLLLPVVVWAAIRS